MRTRAWFVFAGLAAIAFLAVIIILADRGRLPDFIVSLYAFPYGDKLGHFCLMGGVSFCVNLALAGRQGHWRGVRLPLGSLLISAAVTLEEISQNFFSNRTFDLLDLTASLLGIWLLGAAAVWLLAYFRRPLATQK